MKSARENTEGCLDERELKRVKPDSLSTERQTERLLQTPAVIVPYHIDLLNLTYDTRVVLEYFLAESKHYDHRIIGTQFRLNRDTLQEISPTDNALFQLLSPCTHVALSHPMAYRYRNSRDGFCWQILNKMIAKKDNIVVWYSDSQLLDGEHLVLKSKTPDKAYTIKIRTFVAPKREKDDLFYARKLKEAKKNFTDKVQREYTLGRQLPHLHAKPPILTSTYDGINASVSASRFFHEKTLEEVLFESLKDAQGVETGEVIKKPLSLSTDDRLMLIIQFLRAIYWQMHVYSIVHQDIKPANVIVDLSVRPFKVNIIDLDLSNGEGVEPMRGAGTPVFMPYEAFKYHPTTYSFDVYCAHWIIHFLLGGHLEEPTEMYQAELIAMYRMSGDFTGLFSDVHDLIVEHQRSIINLLKGMTSSKPFERSSVLSILRGFEYIFHQRQTASLDKEIRSFLDQAFNQGSAVRGADETTFSIPKATGLVGIARHFKLLDFNAIQKLEALISGGLEKIKEDEGAIRVYIDMLCIEALRDLTTKEAVSRKLSGITSLYLQTIRRFQDLQQSVFDILELEPEDKRGLKMQVDRYIQDFLDAYRTLPLMTDNLVKFTNKLMKVNAWLDTMLNPSLGSDRSPALFGQHAHVVMAAGAVSDPGLDKAGYT